MTDLFDRPATYADLEAVPPHLVAEILHGRLVTHPRPTKRHVGAVGTLHIVIGNAYQLRVGGPGGWVFFEEPELHLGPHVVVPDLAGWRVERLTEPAEKAYFEVAPDWVCEALSPRAERYDKGEQRQIYHEYGVADLWFLDPRVQGLETFARNADGWLVMDTCFDDSKVRAAPFKDIEFPLALLWPLDRSGNTTS